MKVSGPIKSLATGLLLGGAILAAAVIATPAKASDCRMVYFGCLVCTMCDGEVVGDCHVNEACMI